MPGKITAIVNPHIIILFCIIFITSCESVEKGKALKSISNLISSLQSPDTQQQQQAMLALAEIGKPAIDPLLNFVKTAEESQQKKAVRILKVIGIDKMGGKQKVVYYLYTGYPDKAIASGKDVIPIIIEAMNRYDQHIQADAAWMLGELDYDISRLSLQQQVIYYVCRNKPDQAAAIGSKAVDTLLKMLDNDNYFNSAVAALGQIGDKRAIEPIAYFLGNDSKSVVSALALKKIKIDEDILTTDQRIAYYFNTDRFEEIVKIGQPSISYLRRRLLDETISGNAIVIADIISSLTDIGGDEAVEALSYAARNKLQIRLNCTEALVKMNALEGYELLSEMVDNTPSQQWQEALRICRKYPTAKTVEFLTGLSTNTNQEIRDVSEMILADFKVGR